MSNVTSIPSSVHPLFAGLLEAIAPHSSYRSTGLPDSPQTEMDAAVPAENPFDDDFSQVETAPQIIARWNNSFDARFFHERVYAHDIGELLDAAEMHDTASMMAITQKLIDSRNRYRAQCGE